MDARLQEFLEESQRIVFFGGAGVSTESGIPDFRSADGLYSQKYAYPAEEMLSHHFFTEHPEEFYRFYREKMIYPEAVPNAAHRALAAWEKSGKDVQVVTQNVDGLHQAAGSTRVWELHGSVARNYCLWCAKQYPLAAILESQGVPRCSCGGIIRPDVVLYEEPLDDHVVHQAAEAISKAQLLIVGGTSLNVYPAAGLLQLFRGNHLVVINKTPTSADRNADLVLTQAIGAALSDQ